MRRNGHDTPAAIFALNELLLGSNGIFKSSETTEFVKNKISNTDSLNGNANEWKEVVLRLSERLLDEYLASPTFDNQSSIQSAVDDEVCDKV